MHWRFRVFAVRLSWFISAVKEQWMKNNEVGLRFVSLNLNVS
jgi:hypothetical protein